LNDLPGAVSMQELVVVFDERVARVVGVGSFFVYQNM
jgi:hypothetical protein